MGWSWDSKCFLVPSWLRSSHGILSNFIWIPNTNQQNFFFKQMIFSRKASDSTTKILTASERGCCESDNYGFHLFPGSWRRKLTKAMGCLQGAVCNHYLETDGQLCKKNSYSWYHFSKQLNEQFSKGKKKSHLKEQLTHKYGDSLTKSLTPSFKIFRIHLSWSLRSWAVVIKLVEGHFDYLNHCNCLRSSLCLDVFS